MDTSILGYTVKDRITGFRGVVTGICAYVSGCHQVLIVPPMSADGKLPDSHWFDVQRCEIEPGTNRLVFDNGATPGCDRAAPKR